MADRYEFVLEGDTAPTFTWRPAVTPDSSSTSSPAQAPVLPSDSRR
ncbi:S-type pyocin domain-containing protein [Pseudomonas sp.]